MDDRRKAVKNEKQRLIAADKAHIWHPFTQMADWVKDVPSEPLVIDRAKGAYLYDIDGARYLDGVSSLWVTVHGHRHPAIDGAVRAQLGKMAHSTFLGLTHAPAITLAERLAAVTPKGLTRAFYSDNGSTSVEIALKMAYQYWVQTTGSERRKTFLSLTDAYHGDTIGSVSVGGIDLFHSKFRPLLFKAHHMPSPSCYRCPHRGTTGRPAAGKTFADHCRKNGCTGECLAAAGRLLEKHAAEIAAVVVEPLMQGAAGMLKMPRGYLKGIEKLCRRHDVLLICDEVATGFGRTGKMFACEHENVRPDFLCMSKGITGGYLPLAVTMTTERVYRGFLGKAAEAKTFFHGHTYTANPLACAAALASLDLFEREKTLERMQPRIAHLRAELERLAEEIPWVGDIRQTGFMVGVELVADPATGEPFPAERTVGARVCAACRARGVIVRPLSDVIVFMPPLIVDEKEITRLVDAVRDAAREVLGG